jgi:hypothetical protein
LPAGVEYCAGSCKYDSSKDACSENVNDTELCSFNFGEQGYKIRQLFHPISPINNYPKQTNAMLEFVVNDQHRLFQSYVKIAAQDSICKEKTPAGYVSV